MDCRRWGRGAWRGGSFDCLLKATIYCPYPTHVLWQNDLAAISLSSLLSEVSTPRLVPERKTCASLRP